MKKNLLMAMLGLVVTLPVCAEMVVVDGSLNGAGIAVYEAKANKLTVFANYSRQSPKSTIAMKSKQKIFASADAKGSVQYDQSKVVISSPVTVVLSKNSQLLCTHDRSGTPLKKDITIKAPQGAKVEFLYAMEEGIPRVVYDQKICEAESTKQFDKLSGKSSAEEWIHLVDQQKKSLGWLLIDPKQNQVIEIDRKF